jgi:hypothetical protein
MIVNLPAPSTSHRMHTSPLSPLESPRMGDFEPVKFLAAHGSEVHQNGGLGGEMQNFEVGV